eukprot:TRINITY_DN1164_c0_g1_i3.p1 TRINITY_DN1164_c0_g1~~TRINITY_DN1164_c0_g1_i3.p1  ORF type:complete len:996 (-),score=269.73 TRINITY_DN1164_c0_g1_i3:166-3153(-)
MAESSRKETVKGGTDAGECSDATIEIKLKTLDSQTYTFQVNKNMPVIDLKEKIVSVTNVPVDQQRLICRGRVLKNDQRLSDYQIEDGHTLHLVVRQPAPTTNSSTAAGPSGIESASDQGNDATAGTSRNRIGQVSHNMVFGTFNIQDQTDGGLPDLNRILSTVLNSIGLGNIAPTNAGSQNPQQGMDSQEQEQNNHSSNGERQTGSQQQQPGISFPNIQFEPIPNNFPAFASMQQRLLPHDLVVPDAISTLGLYLNRLEQAFAHSGFDSQPSSSTSSSTGSIPQSTDSGLPQVSRGLPQPASLGVVIRRTIQLLNGPAGTSFSQLAGQLEGENTIVESAARGQLQSQALWNGAMMQELGALLLELGRVTQTLRLGQSHHESVVNSGPAVYISPNGPTPIMVQPQNLQRSGILGAFPPPILQPNLGVPSSTVGTGDMPRNISIHIHAGSSLPSGAVTPTSVSTTQSETQGSQPQTGQSNQAGNTSTATRESGHVHVVPVRTVVAAVPAHSATDAISSGTLNVFYPLLARFQQMSSGQGGPVLGVNQISSSGTTNGIQSQPSEGFQIPSVMPTGTQTANSVSTTTTLSVAVVPTTSRETPRQTGTVQNDVNQHQTSYDNHPTVHDNTDERPENHDNGNVTEKMASTSSVLNEDNSVSGNSVNKGKEAESLKQNIENQLKQQSCSRDQETTQTTSPAGLGFGGLQPLPSKHAKQKKSSKPSGEKSHAGISDNQTSIAMGQNVLRALASAQSLNDSRRNESRSQSQSNHLVEMLGSMVHGEQSSSGEFDVRQVMSQLIQSPAVNNFLRGVAEQNGAVPPNAFSAMVQEAAQSPAFSSAIQQMSEQISGQRQDVDGNSYGREGRQGGIDLSSLMQQMVPLVSQAMGRTPSATTAGSCESQLRSGDMVDVPSATSSNITDQAIKSDFEPTIQKLENDAPGEEVFRTVVERVSELSNDASLNGVLNFDLLNHLTSTEGLADEYLDLLRRDLLRRLQSNAEKS